MIASNLRVQCFDSFNQSQAAYYLLIFLLTYNISYADKFLEFCKKLNRVNFKILHKLELEPRSVNFGAQIIAMLCLFEMGLLGCLCCP